MFGLGIPELLLLVLMGFWIWMIIDCATKEKGNDRIVWVIIVVFTNVLGAAIYFFVRYLPRRNR